MNRSTQHRPQRETEAKEKGRLKRENSALQKQNARLRKQLEKILHTHQVAEVEAQAEPVAEPKKVGCEACGSFRLKMLGIPSGGTLTVCTDCKHRKKT